MLPRVFTTVSVRLQEYAEAATVHFENHGYKVYPEKRELGFPYTPTLLCRRHATTIIVEVSNRVLFDRVNAWIGYARSCNRDTRVAVCLPPRTMVPPGADILLRKLGAGLYTVQGTDVIERIPPRDMAVNVELPSLTTLPRPLRRLLGSAYEQFNRSQWREGFEDACQALEVEARRYLKAGIKSGRITVMRASGPKNPTPQQIDKMTMGHLADAFSNIQNQNSLDAQIGKVLTALNADRVGVAHHKSKAKTEKSLRAHVGQHMWAIVVVMRAML
jgi:hypothetical protein